MRPPTAFAISFRIQACAGWLSSLRSQTIGRFNGLGMACQLPVCQLPGPNYLNGNPPGQHAHVIRSRENARGGQNGSPYSDLPLRPEGGAFGPHCLAPELSGRNFQLPRSGERLRGDWVTFGKWMVPTHDRDEFVLEQPRARETLGLEIGRTDREMQFASIEKIQHVQGSARAEIQPHPGGKLADVRHDRSDEHDGLHSCRRRC
ncbi:hypothetical protein ACVWXL_008307 [Bradyrhizobium sp. GM22.5]